MDDRLISVSSKSTIRPFIRPFNSLINNNIRLIVIVKFH